jgi:hypothetical protein
VARPTPRHRERMSAKLEILAPGAATEVGPDARLAG